MILGPGLQHAPGHGRWAHVGSWLAALLLGLLLVGCATPARSPAAAGTQAWSGRLALSVEGEQGQSFSGGFELKGGPVAGELSLFTPLGGTAAVLAWAPGSATLRTSDQERSFRSLDALTVAATGASLPVAALFDWLGGTPTPVSGWEVDVSQVGQGRLRAQRTSPPPLAELRVAFEH